MLERRQFGGATAVRPNRHARPLFFPPPLWPTVPTACMRVRTHGQYRLGAPPRFATARLATNPLARRRRWAPASRPMTAPVRPLPVRAPPPPAAAGRPHHRPRRKTRSDGARRRAPALPRDECPCRARRRDADGGVCAAALARPAVRNSWGGGGAARGGGGAFHQAPKVAAAGRRHRRWGLHRCGGVSRGRADATGSATTRIDAVVRSRIVRRGLIMTNRRARRLIPTGSSRASSRLLLHPWLSPASSPVANGPSAGTASALPTRRPAPASLTNACELWRTVPSTTGNQWMMRPRLRRGSPTTEAGGRRRPPSRRRPA